MEFDVDGDNQSCIFKDVLECSAQLTDVRKEKAIQCSHKGKYVFYVILNSSSCLQYHRN